MTTTEVVTLIPAITALIVALVAAFHAIAAKVQAANNLTAHTANASRIAVVEQNLHAIALALPAAVQTMLPQLQAVAAIPQVSAVLRQAAPAMQGVEDVLAAVNAVAEQVRAMKPATVPAVSETVNVTTQAPSPAKAMFAEVAGGVANGTKPSTTPA